MCEVMKCETLCSENITELAKAMLKVQQAVRPANKDNYNAFTKSMYATLSSVMATCRDALIEHGIWVTQFPVNVGNPNTLGLVTKLVHAESGQWQSSLLVMPLPKNDPQGYGSALTYARRYGLSALVGIVTEDDDANLASNHGSSTGALTPPNQRFNGSQKPTNHANLGHINQFQPKNKQTSKTRELPKIDGVVFNTVKSPEGAEYITASGNTRNKSNILKQAGFTWDRNQKIWWRGVAS